MSLEGNGIITEGEAKEKLFYTGNVDFNQCLIKKRAITFGAEAASLTSYTDNQLVKASDVVVASVFNYDIEFTADFYCHDLGIIPGDQSGYGFDAYKGSHIVHEGGNGSLYYSCKGIPFKKLKIKCPYGESHKFYIKSIDLGPDLYEDPSLHLKDFLPFAAPFGESSGPDGKTSPLQQYEASGYLNSCWNYENKIAFEPQIEIWEAYWNQTILAAPIDWSQKQQFVMTVNFSLYPD